MATTSSPSEPMMVVRERAFHNPRKTVIRHEPKGLERLITHAGYVVGAGEGLERETRLAALRAAEEENEVLTPDEATILTAKAKAVQEALDIFNIGKDRFARSPAPNPEAAPHSPGPWKVQERMTVLEVRGAQNIVDARYRQVATTAQSEVRNPERLANANLMAAAPELKDVVTMFLLNVSSSSVVEKWVEEHMPQTLDAARAILEKIGEPVPTLREIKSRAR